jgi:hypothetical protein
MTIVTNSPPKRQRAKERAQPMQLQQAVITARKPGKRVPAERGIDPEAEARVREFFARMIRPPGL